MSKYLSKGDILGADDRKYEDVLVPEWREDGLVRVQSLMGAEKDAFEASLITTQQIGRKLVSRPNYINARAKLAAKCMVDENGQRLFTDEDVLELGRKSAAALDRVIEVAKRLSAMNEGDLEKLTDNLKNDQPAVSPIA